MNDIKASLLCDRCAEKIESYGYPCTALMNLVCAYNRYCQLLDYDENDDKDLLILKQPATFLESKGYIVTSEISESKVALLPNFYNCVFDEENNKFCWCGT